MIKELAPERRFEITCDKCGDFDVIYAHSLEEIEDNIDKYGFYREDDKYYCLNDNCRCSDDEEYWAMQNDD